MTVVIDKIDRREGLRAMPNVTKETFQGYTPDSKLNTLFDYQREMHGLLTTQIKSCGKRFDKVETAQRKWKLVSGTVAIGSGLFGGFMAMVMKFAFWK